MLPVNNTNPLLQQLQGKEKNVLAYTLEVLKYRGDRDLFDELSRWQIPRFPISGKDLIAAGVPKGRGFGEFLDKLKDRWMESNFTSSREELLKTVTEMLKGDR